MLNYALGTKVQSFWLFDFPFGVLSVRFATHCRIHGTFGAGKPVWAPRKWSQKIEECSTQKLFYETVNLIFFVLNLLKAGHLRHLPLNQARYDQRKTWRIHEKNMQQLPKSQCTIVISFWICNRWPFKTTWSLFIRGSKLLISIGNN